MKILLVYGTTEGHTATSWSGCVNQSLVEALTFRSSGPVISRCTRAMSPHVGEESADAPHALIVLCANSSLFCDLPPRMGRT